MDSRLFSDLIRQCWDTQRLTDRMHRDLPSHFRDDWPELPWSRYRVFYGVLVPVVIHDALFRLHDIPYSSDHRKVMTAQGLITGLFDDLFDRIHLPVDRIRQLMEPPDYIISSEYIEEHLSQYLFKEINENFTGIPKVLEDSILGIMKAQDQSFHQRDPEIHRDDILRITREKGGQAVLFYRSCIRRGISDEERIFLKDLGGLFQLTNDINDALRDHQAGEITLMTTGLSLVQVREIFMAQLHQTHESWNSLTENPAQEGSFFGRINILVSRSLIALDRYSQLTDPELPFDINKIPRHKILSGLAIPIELRQWYRQYKTLQK